MSSSNIVIQQKKTRESKNNNNIRTTRTFCWKQKLWSILSSCCCCCCCCLSMILDWKKTTFSSFGWLSNLRLERWLGNASALSDSLSPCLLVRAEGIQFEVITEMLAMNRTWCIIHQTRANHQISNSVRYCSRNLTLALALIKDESCSCNKLVSRHCLNKSNWWLSSSSSNLSANK